jgi:S-DNA-T family DNA segregation ATPase FtsK/SpoIIIE
MEKLDNNSKKNEEILDGLNGFKFRHAFLIIFVLLLLLSLFSHAAADLAVLDGGYNAPIQNWIGPVGARISKFLLLYFGIAAYPLLIFAIICALRPLIPVPTRRKGYVGAVIAVIFGISILFGMFPEQLCNLTENLGIGHTKAPTSALSGGVIGQTLAAPVNSPAPGFIRHYIGAVGTFVVGAVLAVTGIFFIWFADWQLLITQIRNNRKKEKLTNEKNSPKEEEKIKKEEKTKVKAKTEEPKENLEVEETTEPEENKKLSKIERAKQLLKARHKKEVDTPVKELTQNEIPKENLEDDSTNDEVQETKPVDPVLKPTQAPSSHAAPVITTEADNPQKKVAKVNQISYSDYQQPPLALLKKQPQPAFDDKDFVQEKIEILQATLDSFNIDATVSGAVVGPRVTRYEITPEPGVKVEKITSLSNNIAMDMEATSIRIMAPIPGKNSVGVEVPNPKSSMVTLRGMFEDSAWANNKGQIPVVLGKNVSGDVMVTDLAKAPHLLIAGATGSGKSVCMNTLLMSLLYRFSPDDLRLIMVDPKVVEFEIYKTIPHLITPIVNDPHKVPYALKWAINEMERRYRVLSKVGVRNLESFNARKIDPSSEPTLDHEGNPIPQKLPFIIILIDELADIMMIAKADVETSIARIAQKARAVGIHMVLATQTPRKDIITGVIKANLPTRIAFRVGSLMDSRVILDRKGAEMLLGAGDMLFLPPGSAELERVQGSWVTDDEIKTAVDFISDQAEQRFMSGVTDNPEELAEAAAKSGATDTGSPATNGILAKFIKPDDDDNFKKALEIVLRDRKASTSYIQRRLRIGYNKAADIIDKLEAREIIGPQPSSGSNREILVEEEL